MQKFGTGPWDPSTAENPSNKKIETVNARNWFQ